MSVPFVEKASTAVVLSSAAIIIGVVLLAIQQQWSIRSDISDLKNDVKGIARVETKLSSIETTLNDVQREIRISNMDIRGFLSKAKVPFSQDVEILSVRNELVVFPTTDEAAAGLAAASLPSVQITPTMTGYRLDASTADAVESSIESTASTGSSPPKGSTEWKNLSADPYPGSAADTMKRALQEMDTPEQ